MKPVVIEEIIVPGKILYLVPKLHREFLLLSREPCS